jgi:hypothetical protein
MKRPLVIPNVTHFVQYLVESVQENEDGWQINFENGGIIKHTVKKFKPNKTAMEELPGLGLITTIIHKDEIVLKFGKRDPANPNEILYTDVKLDPTKVEISDPRYEVLPEVEDDDAELPSREEMEARTAEGPENAEESDSETS